MMLTSEEIGRGIEAIERIADALEKIVEAMDANGEGLFHVMVHHE
ncbi:hypothetical protein SEA_RIKSENGUPTA_78 [Microbacterium phage RikSengupta]|nr:hypothetical protein SEA_RIKSENGUPTA_78 [Microbacterium phage RikSengupta]